MHEYISHWVLQLFWHLRSFSLSLSLSLSCSPFTTSSSLFFYFLSAVVSATWSNLVAYLWHSLTFVLVDVGERCQRAAWLRPPKSWEKSPPPPVSRRAPPSPLASLRDCYRFTWKQTGKTNSHLLCSRTVRSSMWFGFVVFNLSRLVTKHAFFYGFHPLLNNKNNRDTWEIPIDVSVAEHVGKHRFLILPQISRIHLMPCR